MVPESKAATSTPEIRISVSKPTNVSNSEPVRIVSGWKKSHTLIQTLLENLTLSVLAIH